MRGGVRRLYSIFFRSVWQTPHASTRIRISPSPIAGVSTSSTDTTLDPRYTAARMRAGVSEFTAGKIFSKVFGGNRSTARQPDQLSHSAGAQHGATDQAARIEPAIRHQTRIEVVHKSFICQVADSTNAIKR